MKSLRKWIYVFKYLKSKAIDEYNRKDNYIFRTNFDKNDIELYKKISKKLGIDYRIEDNATDCYGRPLNSHYAYYVHNSSDTSEFTGLYMKLKNK